MVLAALFTTQLVSKPSWCLNKQGGWLPTSTIVWAPLSLPQNLAIDTLFVLYFGYRVPRCYDH